MLNFLNDTDGRDPADPGNGFLMEQGYTMAMSGWQPDYPLSAPVVYVALGSRLPDMTETMLGARLPIAVQPDGSPITAPDREPMFDLGPAPTLTGYLTYPAANLEDPAQLMTRDEEDDPWREVPAQAWHYVDELRIAIDRTAAGASPSAIWEFRYTSRDPFVYGLGLASMRDLVSWLRNDDDALAVVPGQGRDYVFGFGASQTGRTLKELVSLFPSDEQGRQLFDGVSINISGAGRNAANSAFARPGLKVGHHGTRELDGDVFPFTYASSADPLQRGMEAGLLDLCMAEGTCPRVFHIDSENELWHGGALTFVDPAGEDLVPPDNVRLYALAATEHSPSGGNGTPPICRVRQSNGIDYRPMQRALLTALDAWATRGVEPPASAYPMVSNATLVPPDEVAFPEIPGADYAGTVSRRYVVDFFTMPPGRGPAYPVLAPQVDADGNGIAGIRHPWVSAPLATHAGWNYRPEGMGGDDLCMIYGMRLPFAPDEAAREATGDPRPSVAARYASEVAYAEEVRAAARALVPQGYLLEADVEPIVEGALERYRAATAGE